MKKTKKIVFAVGLAILVLVLAPFLVPTQSYLQKAQQLASDQLGVPVTIASGYLRFLPSPRLVASGIVVGDNQAITVEAVVLVPTLLSLFSQTKQVDLTIIKPVIKKEAMTIISALSAQQSNNAQSLAVNIRQVDVDEMQLVWTDTQLPALNAEIAFTQANRLGWAVIESLDGKLKADISPKGEQYLIAVDAKNWTLPIGLPLLINQARFVAHVESEGLRIPKVDVALYGGKLTGDAVLNWPDNRQKNKKSATSWKASGRFNIENLSVQEPSRLMSQAVYLSGNLHGNGQFSASAKDATQLADRLQGTINFKVNDGVLHGLDLVKVASLLLKQSQNGGQTQFDAFSGQLNVAGAQYHLRDLNISSGLLAATGQVKVKPNKSLDGAVEVELKHSVSLVAIPLDVSGTVSKPVVLPSKAALAGAAAGTAILGPGVGTGLGIKAAGALDSVKELFGSNQ